MKKHDQIKKEIKFKGLVIRLYHKDDFEISEMRSSNIIAFDTQGKLIWIAEKPTYGEYYWEMQIDEDLFFLEADAGTGRRYHIDLSNGHITKTYIVK